MWLNGGARRSGNRSSEELVLPPHHGPFLHRMKFGLLLRDIYMDFTLRVADSMDSNGKSPRIILIDQGLGLAVKNDLVSRWMVRYSLSVNRVF
jgi:hypothetical protein